MWERGPVIASASRLLERARSGRGGALLISGQAGMGKTAVLDHVRGLAAPSMRIGAARGHTLEELLGFGVLGEAIAAAGGPLLADPDDAGGPGARAHLFRAVLRWLETAGPVLLAVDDLHWADRDSLSFLSFLCRRLGDRAAAVVATLRPWPPAAEELCTSLAGEGCAEVERLEPLTPAGAALFLADRVGRPVSDVIRERAWVECAGNPLLLEEVARAIAAGQYGGPGGRGGARLQANRLLARFAGLSPVALRCARAASVLGGRFHPAIAAEVAGVGGDEAEVALEALHRTGMLRQQVALAEFVHPLLSRALYQDIPPPVRTHLHARAFDVLRRRGLGAQACEHAIRADLTGDEAAITLLEETGRGALRDGATVVALRHLDAAVHLAADRAPAGLLLALGEALLAAGRPGDAARVHGGVAARDDLDPVGRATALRLLSGALLQNGDLEQFLAAGAAAAEVAREVAPAAAVDLTLCQVSVVCALRGPEEGTRLAGRATALAGRAGPAAGARVQAVLGFLSVLGGDPSGAVAVADAARRLIDGPLPADQLECTAHHLLVNSAVVDTCLERHDTAERTLAAALAAERSGGSWGEWRTAVHRVDLLLRRGRLREALAAADRAVTLVESQPVAEAPAAASRGAVLLLLGGYDGEVERCCAHAEDAATRDGQWFTLLLALHVRGWRRLGARDVEGACDSYRRVERLSTQLGIGEPCAVPWARHAVTAHLAAGRLDDAERVVGWLEECAVRLPCRWPRIAAAVGRAALAERRQDDALAETSLRTALELHDEADLPLERVLTLLDWGRFLRRTGQLVKARTRLTEGLRAAQAHGASWLAAQAHDELRAAGGRRRAQTPETLTPQEERVATLAAAGHSNREIADRLSLSAHTVKTHLERVYAKKGVCSRRELVHVLETASPPLAERSPAAIQSAANPSPDGS